MSFFLVVCENGLNRDENVLRRLLGGRDLKILKLDGETLQPRTVRLVEREYARRGQQFTLVLHRDADDRPWRDRREQVRRWFTQHQLQRFARRLVPVVPEPCVERWLCIGAGLPVRRTSALRPCEPYKRAWEGPRRSEHLRLQEAIDRAARSPPEDLAEVLRELGAE